MLKLLVAALATTAFADTVVLKSGETVSGIVERMDQGKIAVEVNGQTRSLDILTVDHIEFDTPHFTEAATARPDQHFQGALDLKEMTRLTQELQKAHLDAEMMLSQIKTRWAGRSTLDQTEARRWAAEKERFSAPLARYRAALDEIYLHVAGQVDEYNRIAKDGNDFYMGVKGLLATGSPLVPEDKKELQPKEVLPRGWWDRIFYDGYSKGYKYAREFDRLTP